MSTNTISGTNGNDSLRGTDGDDLIEGGLGIDTLMGGAGDDRLDGGAGADKLTGGSGDDDYVIDNAGDVITELAGEGHDNVFTTLSSYTLGANLEQLYYTGTAAFTGTGNALDNLIQGGNGGNRLDGGAGNDVLGGGSGNDSIQGGLGDDTIVGIGGGKDTVDGGAGQDLLQLAGAFGDYTVTRSSATDTLLTDAAGNTITLRNVEAIEFSDGKLTLAEVWGNKASAFNDVLHGTAGNDVLNGLGGIDTLSGGDGDDTYVIANAASVVNESAGEGHDLVQVALTAAGTYTLADNVEDATVTAAASIAVSLTGNALDNALTGNAAANTLTGGAGNDTLDGGAGADKLIGGSGNDTYVVDVTGDVVTELAGEGTDTVHTKLASYTLGANVENLKYTGTASFSGIGNALDNVITGGSGADSLQGGLGNDIIIGGGGKDSIDGGTGTDSLLGLDDFSHYTVARPNITDTVLTHDNGTVITVRGIESFDFGGVVMSLAAVQDNVGSVANDNLLGTSGNDTLDGGAGIDTLSGGAGDDTYVVDRVLDVVIENPGEGRDLVNVAFSTAGTYVLTDNVEDAQVVSAANIAVNLTGNALDNNLLGNAAANTLIGGAGDDMLDGGAGADKMIGGTGDDYYAVDNVGDVVTELAGEGRDVVFTSLASYTLGANLEALGYSGSNFFTGTGNALDNNMDGGNAGSKLDGGAGNDTMAGGYGNDSLLGGSGDDFLVVSAGRDTIDGGVGTDTLRAFGTLDSFTITRSSNTDTVLTDASGNATTVRNIEKFNFNGGVIITLDELLADRATPFDDKLTGTSGADTLNGGAGADTLTGGDGNDTYVIASVNSSVVENAGEGEDLVQVALTTAGTYVLAANVEHATVTAAAAVAASITGNALDNKLTGNAAANTLIGGAGNDRLDGGAGADKLIGGVGEDTYVVDAAGDVVTELLDEGIDSVLTTLASYTLAANVESLYYIGSGNFSGTGNALDNLIIGGTGNDSLQGGAGYDSLYARSGRDTIDGGADADMVTLDGTFASFTITRPTATDTVFTDAAGNVTTVRNVELFYFSDGVKGLEQVHHNIASPGNDYLQGTDGNDLLDGGAGGVDTLIGGLGDDTYVISNAASLVVEDDNEDEIDLVQVALTAAGTYKLAANVENATVTADAKIAVNLTGNQLNNVLTGNAAANTLTGGDGRDTLDGGAGADRLLGGDDDDTYIVSEAGDTVVELAEQGWDTVRTTLSSYTLGANVEGLTYTGSGAFTGTGNGLNNAITGGNNGNKLDGGAGDDFLRGGSGNDSMQGGAGDDRIAALGSGKDTIDGGDGADILFVPKALADYKVERLSSIETRLTDADGNVITFRNVEEVVSEKDLSYYYQLSEVWGNKPSAYNDKLVGSDNSDTLDGGLGIDTMAAGAGDDTYIVDNVADVVTELAGEGDVDKVQVALTAAGTYVMTANVEYATVTAAASVAVNITGNALDNVITGNAAANTLIGGAGNDRLDGGAGADKLVGGSGDDTYYVAEAGDVVTELVGEGNDLVYTTLASLTLAANVEELRYTGSAAFTGTGNALDNRIDGGLSSNNKLDGGAGNDTLRGGAANDTLLGGVGNDVLADGVNDGSGTGTGNDSLDGGAGDDEIWTEGGRDTIDGGSGDDVLHLSRAFDQYTVRRPNATDTVLHDQDGNIYTVRNVESIIFDNTKLTLAQVHVNVGSVGDDNLTGTSGNDVLDGGLGVDTLSGGLGDDTYVITNVKSSVVENADEGSDLVRVALTATGTYVLAENIENATVTAAATVAVNLTGNALDNQLTGNAAANTLLGGAGNDTLDGGEGADKLNGGTGDDSYVVDAAGDVVTELAGEGTDLVNTTLASYKLTANVENLRYTGVAAFSGSGNELDNLIIGGNGANKLDGGAGNDTLTGGSGNDSLLGGLGDDSFSGGGGKDTIDGGAGNDTLTLSGNIASYTLTRVSDTDLALTDAGGIAVTVRSVESIVFADGVKTLDELQYNLVSDFNDSLNGTAGNDTLDGKKGVDTLVGGAGDDIYVLDNVADVVIELEAQGTDLVQVTAAGIYTLGAYVENGTVLGTVAASISGNALDNLLTGNGAANTLTGGAGNDTLDGGAGADKLVGGVGDDVYIVDSASDVVTELANQGQDQVRTTLASYTLAANVEALQYTGGGVFTGSGNELGNLIIGGNGANKLDGGAGNDTLTGGSGNDSLLGGLGDDSFISGGGKDTIDGGAGNDTLTLSGNIASYTVTRLNDTDLALTDAGGVAVTVRAVESIIFADGVKLLSEVQGTAGSDFNDYLSGSAGNDTLDGKKGIDTMAGGAGDDIYVVDNVRDVVIEQNGQGTDLVQVTAAGVYTLGDNVENGSVLGTVLASLTGNGLDNVLTGNAAANTLIGGAGNDTLDGGAGADKMSGGLGDDVYYVDVVGDSVTELAGEGVDTVQTTLSAYTLGANLDNLVYTGSGTFTGVGNALDNMIFSGNGDAKLDGGAGNDSISGGMGNDSLQGGLGDDMLAFSAGLDTLDGGAGEDTLFFWGGMSDYTVRRVNATDIMLIGNYGHAAIVRNVEQFSFVDTGGIENKTLAQVLEKIGGAGNDSVTGTSGNDKLDGGLGIDTLAGGLGNDTYVISDIHSSVVEQVNEGKDTVLVLLADAGTYVLAENVENAKVISFTPIAVNLTGNALANALTGNAYANILIGGDGRDTLDGGGGQDILQGGADNDQYVVDNAGDVVSELADEGYDQVLTTLSSYTLGAYVEALAYTGSSVFTGIGNELNNSLQGGATGSNLDGGAGNDTLSGGDGNDSMLGGTGDDLFWYSLGKDTLDGGTGNDMLFQLGNFASYQISRRNADDTVLTDAAGNATTVRNVEMFRFADGDKTLAAIQEGIDIDVNLQSSGGELVTLVGSASSVLPG